MFKHKVNAIWRVLKGDAVIYRTEISIVKDQKGRPTIEVKNPTSIFETKFVV